MTKSILGWHQNRQLRSILIRSYSLTDRFHQDGPLKRQSSQNENHFRSDRAVTLLFHRDYVAAMVSFTMPVRRQVYDALQKVATVIDTSLSRLVND